MIINRPLKNIFECLKNVDEQCSSIETEVRRILEKAGEQLSSESTWPTYDQTKMFALQECPMLPTGSTFKFIHNLMFK
jgi:predicted subunit of tRNA(5-methylaminomethyl-2-thiouridylate) methyltransferase